MQFILMGIVHAFVLLIHVFIPSDPVSVLSSKLGKANVKGCSSQISLDTSPEQCSSSRSRLHRSHDDINRQEESAIARVAELEQRLAERDGQIAKLQSQLELFQKPVSESGLGELLKIAELEAELSKERHEKLLLAERIQALEKVN